MAKADVKLYSKLYPNKKAEKKIDTVAYNKEFYKNKNILEEAYRAWNALSRFRDNAARMKMFTFGDQWGDTVKTDCGWIRERDTLICEGVLPITNNLIRGMVRSITGYFQSNQTEPVCVARERHNQEAGEMMSSTIQYVYQNNKLWGLDAENLTYLLVTGASIFKHWYGMRNGVMDVWNDIVNPNRWFTDGDMEDTRGWDCRLVGEIHDMGLYDVIAKFSQGSPEKAKELRRIYSYVSEDYIKEYWDSFVTDTTRNYDFYYDLSNGNLCRVIEVWRKEAKERLLVHDYLNGEYYKAEVSEKNTLDAENRRRIAEQTALEIAPEDMKLIEYEWIVDNYWQAYYFSPFGDVLMEVENPYWHDSHPYSFKLFKYYDRQIFPYVGGVIDQQKMINRLIMMQFLIYRQQAKGVTFYDPEIFDGTGWDAEKFSRNVAKINASIPVNTKKGTVPLPQTQYQNGTTTDISNMLTTAMRLFEEVSNMQGVLQGKSPAGGTPAALYLQQTQNAATSLVEVMEAYRELREDRDLKNLQMIQQFYTEPKYINISSGGRGTSQTMYSPDKVRNLQFTLSLTESTSTPAYRMIQNDFLLQMMQMRPDMFDPEMVLKLGSFPFADKFLQEIESKKKEMAEQQQEAQAQGMAGGDMQAMAQAAAMQQGQPTQNVPIGQSEDNPVLNPAIAKILQNSGLV